MAAILPSSAAAAEGALGAGGSGRFTFTALAASVKLEDGLARGPPFTYHKGLATSLQCPP